MVARFGPPLTAIGGLIAAGTAFGQWPAELPALSGVSLPILGIGFLLIILAAVQLATARDHPVVTIVAAFAVVGVLAMGGFGYWSVLLDRTEAIGPPIVLILAGLVAGVGTLADWFRTTPADATAKARATGLMTIVGFSGLVAMIVWANVLFVVLFFATGRSLSEIELVAVSSLSLGLGTATVTALYLIGSNRAWSFIDLSIPSLRDIGWTVVGTVVLFGAFIAVAAILQALQMPIPDHEIVEVAREGDPRIILYVLIPASFLLIGPGEELLFRNVIQKSLYDHFSRTGAVIVASVLFAIAHFPAYGAGADAIGPIALIFTLSILLGAVYVKTENLLVPSFIHGLFNAVQFASLYYDVTTNAAGIVGLVWGLW